MVLPGVVSLCCLVTAPEALVEVEVPLVVAVEVDSALLDSDEVLQRRTKDQLAGMHFFLLRQFDLLFCHPWPGAVRLLGLNQEHLTGV